MQPAAFKKKPYWQKNYKKKKGPGVTPATKAPGIKFADLPAELHLSIADMLHPQARRLIGQLSCKLRNIYTPAAYRVVSALAPTASAASAAHVPSAAIYAPYKYTWFDNHKVRVLTLDEKSLVGTNTAPLRTLDLYCPNTVRLRLHLNYYAARDTTRLVDFLELELNIVSKRAIRNIDVDIDPPGHFSASFTVSNIKKLHCKPDHPFVCDGTSSAVGSPVAALASSAAAPGLTDLFVNFVLEVYTDGSALPNLIRNRYENTWKNNISPIASFSMLQSVEVACPYGGKEMCVALAALAPAYEKKGMPLPRHFCLHLTGVSIHVDQLQRNYELAVVTSLKVTCPFTGPSTQAMDFLSAFTWHIVFPRLVALHWHNFPAARLALPRFWFTNLRFVNLHFSGVSVDGAVLWGMQTLLKNVSIVSRNLKELTLKIPSMKSTRSLSTHPQIFTEIRALLVFLCKWYHPRKRFDGREIHRILNKADSSPLLTPDDYVLLVNILQNPYERHLSASTLDSLTQIADPIRYAVAYYARSLIVIEALAYTANKLLWIERLAVNLDCDAPVAPLLCPVFSFMLQTHPSLKTVVIDDAYVPQALQKQQHSKSPKKPPYGPRAMQGDAATQSNYWPYMRHMDLTRLGQFGRSVLAVDLDAMRNRYSPAPLQGEPLALVLERYQHSSQEEEVGHTGERSTGTGQFFVQF